MKAVPARWQLRIQSRAPAAFPLSSTHSNLYRNFTFCGAYRAPTSLSLSMYDLNALLAGTEPNGASRSLNCDDSRHQRHRAIRLPEQTPAFPSERHVVNLALNICAGNASKSSDVYGYTMERVTRDLESVRICKSVAAPPSCRVGASLQESERIRVGASPRNRLGPT